MAVRAEQTIDADGREVRLLYTNRALADIEQQTGKSVIQIAQGFTAGNSGITDVAHALRAGMEAHRRDSRVGGKPVTMEDAYQVMDAVGFAEVAAVVMGAVAEVIGYSGKDGSPNAPHP